MITAQAVELYAVPLDNYLTVQEGEKIYSALKTLNDSMHRGGAWQGHRLVVVVNDSGQPTGLLTLKSVLRAVGFKMLEEDPFFKAECFSWYYISKTRRNGGITAREAMRPLGLFSIGGKNTVREAARMFARHGINYLPVTDGENTVGILSRRDLFYRCYECAGFMPARESRADTPAPVNLLKEPATV